MQVRFSTIGTHANSEAEPSSHPRLSDVDTNGPNIETNGMLRAVDVAHGFTPRHFPERLELLRRSEPRLVDETNQQEQYSYTDTAEIYRRVRQSATGSALAAYSQLRRHRRFDGRATAKTQQPKSDFQPENFRDLGGMPQPAPQRIQSDSLPVPIWQASNLPLQRGEITEEPRLRIVEPPNNDNLPTTTTLSQTVSSVNLP